MIPQETIGQIFETARVEEVVGDYVSLKKKGTNMWGLCPFHNEKTPSFSVSPSKGIYKCFGCGEGGNSVNFIMNHEHMTYPEALRFLAKKYNIEVEEEQLTPEREAELSERESLFLVMQYAQRQFSENLLESDAGKAIGLSYFKERGFSDDTIKKFALGYALDDRKAFVKDALENKHSKEMLVKAGMALDYDNGLVDRFHGRVMFPIRNLSGRTIAFGGRTLRTDKKIAKYINSPETPLYNKSEVLYGIFESKKDIINKDNCFLVEGYTDVISLHQAGIQNVVASSGTSLTKEQIRLIKRLTNNLTVMYDGDAAGIKASFRGIDMILEEGLNVRTLLFPDGEDPDSFAQSKSEEELRDFISENSTDFIQFKSKILAEEAKNDPIKKAALIKDLVESISLIPDPITRSVYVKECSSLMGMSEDLLVAELNRARRKKMADKQKEANRASYGESDIPPIGLDDYIPEQPVVEEIQAHPDVHQERDVVRLLLLYGEQNVALPIPPDEDGNVELDELGDPVAETFNVADLICQELEDNQIEMVDLACYRVIEEYKKALDKNEVPGHSVFTMHQTPEVSKLAVELLSQPYQLSDNWKDHQIIVQTEDRQLRRAILSSLNSLKLRKVERVISEVRAAIDEKPEDIDEKIEHLQMLLSVRSTLAADQGTIILK